ncbi:hypothetical protein MBLNU459_g2155t1 [Dothideomycetes sp. NU459]
MTSYTPDARSKAKRYAKRVDYDKQAVHAVVEATPLLHVSFNAPSDDGAFPQFPTILPMLGAVGAYDGSDESSVYLHGSSAARLSRLTTGSGDAGLPVCVSATILDGYVLALTPFNHSCNYRSAVLFGYATRVTEPDELTYAMELITNRMVSDRWNNSRVPPTKSEVTATGVLKVRIETASVKVRHGGPHDDRKDLKDEALTAKIWTGTVPVMQVLGEPSASPENQVTQVPSHVREWVDQSNQASKEQALKSMEE